MHDQQRYGSVKGSIKGSIPETSFKSSVKSAQSRVTAASLAKIKAEKSSLRKAAMESGAPEEMNDEDLDNLQALPEDFISCNICKASLLPDEKVINARFVNEAMETGRDISVFPICIKCNFE